MKISKKPHTNLTDEFYTRPKLSQFGLKIKPQRLADLIGLAFSVVSFPVFAYLLLLAFQK